MAPLSGKESIKHILYLYFDNWWNSYILMNLSFRVSISFGLFRLFPLSSITASIFSTPLGLVTDKKIITIWRLLHIQNDELIYNIFNYIRYTYICMWYILKADFSIGQINFFGLHHILFILFSLNYRNYKFLGMEISKFSAIYIQFNHITFLKWVKGIVFGFSTFDINGIVNPHLL